jgi:transketolase N-terminal domain/subunit
MRKGIATDHGGFHLKEDLLGRLKAAGHAAVDFGAHSLVPGDDYPDFVIPLARAVSAGKVERGIAVCGSGVGAEVCANKIPGVRAGLVGDHFSAHQGVEDHERPLHGRPHGRPGSRLGVRRDLSGFRIQPGRAPPAPPEQSSCTRGGDQVTPLAETITSTDFDQLSINTIRTLSMDAVQQAKSGHPGTPMALAPLVYTIWNRVMRFDPRDPLWLDRDRFVLSNGHASMLLWSVLHLTRTQAVNADYENLSHASVTLDDIRRFRQLDSRAPRHPEYHWVSGVETTKGPLGQGIATSVGMAIAEKWLANRFNRPGFPMFDYRIYAVAGDGCMMEGIGSEAASLAGHLGLDNLCWIYDNNQSRPVDARAWLARGLGVSWDVIERSDRCAESC